MTGGIPSWWIDSILAWPLRRLVETPKRMLKGWVGAGVTVLDVGCGRVARSACQTGYILKMLETKKDES
jgi:hypothetical protein